MEKSSITKKVAEILDSDAYTQQAIRLGIANYSAIAKKLQRETKGSLEAVKVAVMRYAESLRKTHIYVEKAQGILKNTKLTLKSNVSVLIVEKGTGISEKISKLIKKKGVTIVDSKDHYTVFLDDFQLQDAINIVGKENITKKHSGLYTLLLTSPPQIEETAGVLAFLFDKLAGANINVVEFYSCFTDTGLVLKKENALKGFEIIEKCLR